MEIEKYKEFVNELKPLVEKYELDNFVFGYSIQNASYACYLHPSKLNESHYVILQVAENLFNALKDRLKNSIIEEYKEHVQKIVQ